MTLHLSVKTSDIAAWGDRLGRSIEALEAADAGLSNTVAAPLSALLEAMADSDLLTLSRVDGFCLMGRPSDTAQAYVALIEALPGDIKRVAAR